MDTSAPQFGTPRYSALIALSHNSLPSADAIGQRLAALWPQIPRATDLVEDEAGVALTLEGSLVCIVRRRGAIAFDVTDPHPPSIKAPLSEATLEKQQAHLVVGVHHADAIAAAIAATRVTAAIVGCCPEVLAIYWTAARHWLAPRAFAKRALARLSSGPPVDMWIGCRVWQLDKHTAAGFTLGLQALGHKEFEAVRSREPANDLRERFEGLCSYVLVNGPIVRSGHTVGQNCAERIKIILCRSGHGMIDTVLRLDYDEDFRPARPWWKLI